MTISEQFEPRLKIACFRAITDQLRDNHLVTDEEYRRIMKHLDKQETDLIAGKPAGTHPRKLTEVK